MSSKIQLVPHKIPTIKCNKCGHEHHIDCTTSKYQGHCTKCYGFLRRPTKAEKQKFTNFYM